MKIILASQSESRKLALDILGLEYEVIPSHIDETVIRYDDRAKMAEMLAKAKCKKIAEAEKDAIIISADLFVIFENKIFEKPKDEKEAKEMLKIFSGNLFQIISGLAVLNSKIDDLFLASESSIIKFRELADYEIDDYVSRYPVTKFAGAFDDDGTLRFAEYIEGNYNFRAGLPVNRLVEFLRKNNVQV